MTSFFPVAFFCLQPPACRITLKRKNTMKRPLTYLATLAFLAFLMVLAIQCPPLAFFAVPVGMLLIALAAGV